MQFSNPFLGQTAACSCGKTHEIPIDIIVVDTSIRDALLSHLQQKDGGLIQVVCDANTYPVMGQKVCTWLQEAQLQHDCFVFEHPDHLLPDEGAIEAVSNEIKTHGATHVLAVGSGVINDIARYASYKEKIPYSVIATAPSMDGYASSVAALQFAGLKTTLPAHAPKGIFAESAVLANAPFALRQSGFGDLIGKVISLMDWKLSHNLYGEYFCQTSYEMVRQPLAYCAAHAKALYDGDESATIELFSGLINAGLAMAMMGNSRPCSGSEHHCSHYWDLLAFHNRREHKSHGLQVGYATGWMIRFYRSLGAFTSIKDPVVPSLTEAYRRELETVYGVDGAAPIFDVIRGKQTFQSQPNRYAEWTIDDLVETLQPEWSMLEQVESALDMMHISDQMEALDLDVEMLHETFLHANELRERFTIFDFLNSQEKLTSVIKTVVS